MCVTQPPVTAVHKTGPLRVAGEPGLPPVEFCYDVSAKLHNSYDDIGRRIAVYWPDHEV